MQAAFCGPPNIVLIAFEPGHAEVLSANPRHTLHVPITMSAGSTGSSRNGASISDASFATCAYPMVGEPVKFVAAHALPLPQVRMLTPASVDMYQFCGLVGSMATVPPSPAEICGQADVVVAAPVAAVPFAPSPANRVAGSVGCSAKRTTSASEPRPELRFWKWVASSAEQGVCCWFTPSSERQRPPSLPT